MLSWVLAGVFAGTPPRELLFAASPLEQPPGELGCDTSPCAGLYENRTCVNYPDHPGVDGPSCRACVGDPDALDSFDPAVPTDSCDVAVKSQHFKKCRGTVFISDPPECCIYGGPFADEVVHQLMLGGLPNTTGLPYGVKGYWTTPSGYEGEFCIVHKKVLTEIGEREGYHPAMVRTLFSFDPAYLSTKMVGGRRPFCDEPDNGIPEALSFISTMLAAKGNVRWHYDCAPDDPFAHVQAEIAEATAWIGMSPEGGCRYAKFGEEPCDNPTAEKEACEKADDKLKLKEEVCASSREAQWAAWLAHKTRQ